MVVARNLTLLRNHEIVVLHVSEAEGADGREYSYHWQKNDKLIRRWDNAPHHKNLPNFPHHIHEGGNVISGDDMNLVDILAYIGMKIKD